MMPACRGGRVSWRSATASPRGWTIRWEVAEAHGATLIDLWADDGFRHVRMWSEDRLHLSGLGHRRVASLVLEALGQPYQEEWRMVLPWVPSPSWVAARRADVRWARQHLAPWIHRRLTGRSSGDLVRPKRPELAPVTVDGATG